MGTHLSPEQSFKSKSLSETRESTKIAILKKRTLLGIPVCPICNKPLVAAGDPHEVFLTRGDVQSNRSEIQELIHVPQNCVIVHPVKCHLVAQHEETGKLLCAQQIVTYEEYANVMTWLKGLSQVMRSRIPGDEIKWLSQHENKLLRVPGGAVVIDKQRVYEIVETIGNKKERDAVIRVLNELYAVYESGETLSTTNSRQIRKLLRAYRKNHGFENDDIPALGDWVNWLVVRSGVPVLRNVSKSLSPISEIMDRIGSVNIDSSHFISGMEVMSTRLYLNHATKSLSE